MQHNRLALKETWIPDFEMEVFQPNFQKCHIGFFYDFG